MEKKIIIIGAGPCGLGAGHRLSELEYRNWVIHEKNDYVGGLAASFIDKQGFTWDLGGHVLFSHYQSVDRIIDDMLGYDHNEHTRKSFIRVFDGWIPYPFQNNLRFLPDDVTCECLLGLFRVATNGHAKPTNFKEWIEYTFGDGISKYFMIPYNRKVWNVSLESMSFDWIAERVSVIDFEHSLKNVILRNDDIKWGPNKTFRFPAKGGTGEIFRRIAAKFHNHISFGKEIVWIDANRKLIGYSDGSTEIYDTLLTTIPLDQLVMKINNSPESVKKAAQKLAYNSVTVVGVGFDRSDSSQKNWMYFPEDRYPFYRTTYFSNYSPNNVPNIRCHFSLMGEVSHSAQENLKETDVVESTIQGFVNSDLVENEDCRLIKSVFTQDLDYAYPIPTLDRDKALTIIQSYLEENDIFSRGRFGAWKYEIGNMDHSVMQGVEIVDRLLLEKEETVIFEN